MRIKSFSLIIAAVLMMVMFILYPHNCLDSALSGLELWAKTVLPSLLPFVVASFILLETGIVALLSAFFSPVMKLLFNAPGQSAYVLLASSLSGYPAGARLTGELFDKGSITESEAARTLRFTSVSGPVFITGAVSAGMLTLPEAGAYLAASHYLSAILVGIIFGLFGRKKQKQQKTSIKDALAVFKQSLNKTRPLGDIMTDSVTKALAALIKVGGFIVFFSVISEILSQTGVFDFLVKVLTPSSVQSGGSLLHALLVGSVELTGGCAHAASLSSPVNIKLSVISFIIAFGGFCVHMQTRAVCGKIKPKLFTLAKLLQGVLAYVICMMSLKLFPLSVSVSTFPEQTKTAAYLGVVFAAVSILILVIIKLVQRKSTFPLTR